MASLVSIYSTNTRFKVLCETGFIPNRFTFAFGSLVIASDVDDIDKSAINYTLDRLDRKVDAVAKAVANGQIPNETHMRVLCA